HLLEDLRVPAGSLAPDAVVERRRHGVPRVHRTPLRLKQPQVLAEQRPPQRSRKLSGRVGAPVHDRLLPVHVVHDHRQFAVSPPHHAAVVDVGRPDDGDLVVHNHQLAVNVHQLLDLISCFKFPERDFMHVSGLALTVCRPESSDDGAVSSAHGGVVPVGDGLDGRPRVSAHFPLEGRQKGHHHIHPEVLLRLYSMLVLLHIPVSPEDPLKKGFPNLVLDVRVPWLECDEELVLQPNCNCKKLMRCAYLDVNVVLGVDDGVDVGRVDGTFNRLDARGPVASAPQDLLHVIPYLAVCCVELPHCGLWKSFLHVHTLVGLGQQPRVVGVLLSLLKLAHLGEVPALDEVTRHVPRGSSAHSGADVVPGHPRHHVTVHYV
ncbi:unnamed protein product, partial [Ixodes hexagonus]